MLTAVLDSLSSLTLTHGEDALWAWGDYGEGEEYTPMLIFLPFLKGADTGL